MLVVHDGETEAAEQDDEVLIQRPIHERIVDRDKGEIVAAGPGRNGGQDVGIDAADDRPVWDAPLLRLCQSLLTFIR